MNTCFEYISLSPTWVRKLLLSPTKMLFKWNDIKRTLKIYISFICLHKLLLLLHRYYALHMCWYVMGGIVNWRVFLTHMSLYLHMLLFFDDNHHNDEYVPNNSNLGKSQFTLYNYFQLKIFHNHGLSFCLWHVYIGCVYGISWIKDLLMITKDLLYGNEYINVL